MADGNGAGVAVRTPGSLAATKRKTVREYFERHQSEIARALPRGGLTADRLVRIALTECTRTPRLLECTAESLVAAVLTSAQLGLEPDGTLGRAYLIPFRNRKKGVIEAQLQVGYQGLKELALNTDAVQSISATVVREGDEFSWQRGTDPKIEHVPKFVKPRPADLEPDEIKSWNRFHGPPIIAVYAIAQIKGLDRPEFEVMSTEEVEQIRRMSKQPDSPMWTGHWPMGARKTVVKRFCKLLPASTSLQKAVALDDMAEGGIRQDVEVEAGIMPADARVVEDGDDNPKPPPGLAAPKGDGETTCKGCGEAVELVADGLCAGCDVEGAPADRSAEPLFPPEARGDVGQPIDDPYAL